MKNAFEEDMNFGASALKPGVQYDVQLVGLNHLEKVVKYNSSIRDEGKRLKVFNKEYATLDTAQKQLVDSAEPDKFPSGDEVPRFIDKLVFQFEVVSDDPKTNGIKLSTDFDMAYPTAKPGKALREFVAKSSGVVVTGEEGFKWKDVFKPNEMFVTKVVTDEANPQFSRIDTSTLVKKNMSPSVKAGGADLTDKAKALLEYIKGNLNGKPIGKVVDLYNTGQFGSEQETKTAWSEIQSKVAYTKDGKTFGF
jgi:hypothetical protein